MEDIKDETEEIFFVAGGVLFYFCAATLVGRLLYRVTNGISKKNSPFYVTKTILVRLTDISAKNRV